MEDSTRVNLRYDERSTIAARSRSSRRRILTGSGGRKYGVDRGVESSVKTMSNGFGGVSN